MKLSVISPESAIDHEIAWIELNTAKGNRVVQRGHIPCLFLLTQNKPVIFKLKTGKQQTFLVRYGIVQVHRDSIILIVRNCDNK